MKKEVDEKDRITGSVEKEHMPALDGLRGLAVLLVVVAHVFPVSQLFAYYKGPAILLSIGSTGVDLFFVLSGFLITGILCESKGSQHYFKSFYVRRVLRIFPLYYALLAVFIGGTFVPALENLWGPGNRWPYWIYLSNFYPEFAVAPHSFLLVCWSLAIEEQYYLVWPWVVRSLQIRGLILAAAILFVGSWVLRIILYGPNSDHLYHFTFTHLDGIALGSLIRLLHINGHGLLFARRVFPYLLMTVICFWLYAGLDVTSIDRVFYAPAMVQFGWGLTTLMYGALLIVALNGRAFEIPFLMRWGKYSYAIYLTHLIVFWFIHGTLRALTKTVGIDASWIDEFAGRAIMFCIALFAIYFVGKLSWSYVEGPINELKRKFPYSRSEALGLAMNRKSAYSSRDRS